MSRATSYATSQAKRMVNRALHMAEVPGLDGSSKPLAFPPVFIIGAPRSGSTLLYQTLVHAYGFQYLSNRHCRFFGAPTFVERWARPDISAGEANFKSDLGRTRSAGGPSECGEFWYRFFRRHPQYVPDGQASTRRMIQLRGVVRALGDIAGAPPLFKNMPCALRLRPLAQALPEALYIVIQRNLVDNAQSLLLVRKRVHGEYGSWWSMEPPGVEKIRQAAPECQVVEQIRAIHDVISNDRCAIGPSRFLDVEYSDFCSDVEKTLTRVETFLKANHTHIERRGDVPGQFEVKHNVRLPQDIYDRLQRYASCP